MNLSVKVHTEEELKAAIEKATAKYEKLCDESEKAAAAFQKAYVRMMNAEDDLADVCHQINLLQEDYKRTKEERKRKQQKLKKEILNAIHICKDEKCSEETTKLILCITYGLSDRQAASYIQKYGQ